MEFLEFKGKTKDEALMQASVELGVPVQILSMKLSAKRQRDFLV